MDPVIRETVFWSPDVLTPPNAADEINSSAAHGFVFDICGVEIDRDTGRVNVDKYMTVHDAGRLLHPAMADGQIRGGFANALGATLYEHFCYGNDGSFQSGTFADYTVPTAAETPDLEIRHVETPSPITPLGAKGIGEGNCMSTPVCIANAVADALGVEDIELPLTPSRVHALLQPEEPPPPRTTAQPDRLRPLSRTDYAVTGTGSTWVAASPEAVWQYLLDPDALKAIVPGCQSLTVVAPEHFAGTVEFGVGVVKGVFQADVHISDLDPPQALRLTGRANGALGASTGEATVLLAQDGDGTRINFNYGLDLSGKVAAIGGRMIGGAVKVVIGEFFKRLARHADPAKTAGASGPDSLAAWLRGIWRHLSKRITGGRS